MLPQVTVYSDRGLMAQTEYFYRVKVCTDATSSSCSEPSPVTSVTTGFNATVSGGEVTLTWQAVAGADYYEVWRGTRLDGSDRTLINGDGTPALTWQDADVPPRTTLYYWIRACTTTAGCTTLTAASGPVVYSDGVYLNDTGITFGAETSGNNDDCTSAITAPQDCKQGRDARAAAGTLGRLNSRAAAGFDLTRLGRDGTPLANQGETWSEERQ